MTSTTLPKISFYRMTLIHKKRVLNSSGVKVLLCHFPCRTGPVLYCLRCPTEFFVGFMVGFETSVRTMVSSNRRVVPSCLRMD